MGGLAPGQLKSRRGSHSSPRRLHYRFIFFDRDSETHCGKNSYQLCGTSAFSSPSPCGSLALNGPPDWPSPSPPPTLTEKEYAISGDDDSLQITITARCCDSRPQERSRKRIPSRTTRSWQPQSARLFTIIDDYKASTEDQR